MPDGRFALQGASTEAGHEARRSYGASGSACDRSGVRKSPRSNGWSARSNFWAMSPTWASSHASSERSYLQGAFDDLVGILVSTRLDRERDELFLFKAECDGHGTSFAIGPAISHHIGLLSKAVKPQGIGLRIGLLPARSRPSSQPLMMVLYFFHASAVSGNWLSSARASRQLG